MRVIFLGDVVGEPGREAVKAALPALREKYAPDFIVVNGENAAGGHGITPRLVYEILRCKVDVITLGDHSWDQREILPFFEQEPRLIRPFNFPAACPGTGWVVVGGNGKKLGVVSAMGRTFMPAPVDNPVLGIDAVLEQVRHETNCILVDFHAETTSEKIAFGHAVDGRVSVGVGTHTHGQTADEKILPGGTAYLTDAGFCGGHDSVIGRDKEPILERYRTLMPVRMTVSARQPQADGMFAEIDEESGKAVRIERIQQPVELAMEPKTRAA
jgi:metallophosphoesterase (TIGR00282 family)